jgi:hypothetical protein
MRPDLIALVVVESKAHIVTVVTSGGVVARIDSGGQYINNRNLIGKRSRLNRLLNRLSPIKWGLCNRPQKRYDSLMRLSYYAIA